MLISLTSINNPFANGTMSVRPSIPFILKYTQAYKHFFCTSRLEWAIAQGVGEKRHNLHESNV